MSTSQDLLKEKLRRVDDWIDQATNDLKYLQDFENRYIEIKQNHARLMAYYQDEWMQDVDAFDPNAKDEYFACLGQDAIWNVLDDTYRKKLDLLKIIINDIH